MNEEEPDMILTQQQVSNAVAMWLTSKGLFPPGTNALIGFEVLDGRKRLVANVKFVKQEGK